MPALRTLLFAYYFPPDGGAGTQRPTSFARHLPDLGVTTTVITRTSPRERSYYEPEDRTLLDLVESRVRILRTPPEHQGIAGFVAAVERLADEAIRAERPDVLLLTMSPFEMWRAGAAAAERHGIPVVFDLRDPWALDGVQSHRTWFHWRRERSEMRAMLRSASGVVANTPECRTLFLELEPALKPERVTVVTNGWDAEDFPPPPPRLEPGADLRLVFTGSFLCKALYPGRSVKSRAGALLRYAPEPIVPSGRTPYHLLRAIRLLRDRGHAAGRETRLCVVGQKDEWLARCVAESGVADAVEFSGYLAHSESIKAIRHADALYLPLHGLPRGRRSRIVPGKAYEYLATGRPILGTLPEGDAREFLLASGRGYVAEACNDEDTASTLARLHADWRAGRFVESRTGAEIERFERRALAAELVRFLERVCALEL